MRHATDDLKLEFSGILFMLQFSFLSLFFFLAFFQSFGVRDASASHEHTYQARARARVRLKMHTTLRQAEHIAEQS